MLTGVLRSLLSSALGLIISFSFLAYLASVSIEGLLNPQLYADALREQQAYERFYTDALPYIYSEQLLRERLGKAPGGDSPDWLSTLPKIAPPVYLQAQVEANLERAGAYLNKESERLELYLEFAEPLERLEPIILEAALSEDKKELIDRVKSLDLVDQPEPLQLARQIEALKPELSGDIATDAEYQRLSKRYTELAQEAYERSIANAWGLDDRKRIDLLTALSKEMGYASEEELDDQIDQARDTYLGYLENLRRTRIGALVLFIAGLAGMALIYLPNPVNCMRRPGITLLITGSVTFISFWLGQRVLPGRLDALVGLLGGWEVSPPPEPMTLMTDVAGEVLSQFLGGMLWTAAIPLLLGAVLVIASFIWPRIMPRISWISGRRVIDGPG